MGYKRVVTRKVEKELFERIRKNNLAYFDTKRRELRAAVEVIQSRFPDAKYTGSCPKEKGDIKIEQRIIDDEFVTIGFVKDEIWKS